VLGKFRKKKTFHRDPSGERIDMSYQGIGNREGDVVLIYYEDEPAVFARIEAIVPDRKKDWYQLTLLVLTVPAQVVTWILREEYIDGAPFTMGGRPVKLEKVGPATGTPRPGEPRESPEPEQSEKPAKVIPFKKSS
jgi:hypothetical protein